MLAIRNRILMIVGMFGLVVFSIERIVSSLASFSSSESRMMRSVQKSHKPLPKKLPTATATPKQTTRNISYPNIAIKDLYEQHDHLLSRAETFYKQLDQSASLTKHYAITESKQSMQKTKPICLVVMASNRATPYIDLLVYMLTQKQSYEEIFSLAEVHVMNIEQRVGRQNRSYLNNIRKIGFVRYYDFAKDHITPGENYGFSQRKAGKKAMEICKKSQSEWCVILEDDSLPPARFFPLFMQHVIKPLSGKEHLYCYIRLYDPFIDELLKGITGRNIHDSKWVNTWYKTFRMQKREKDVSKKKFKIHQSGMTYGGVAIAYPKVAYKDVLATYAAFGNLETTTEMNDVIIGLHYPNKFSKTKGTIEPSLVTHIGLQSEQDKRAKFSRIFADIRFQTNLD